MEEFALAVKILIWSSITILFWWKTSGYRKYHGLSITLDANKYYKELEIKTSTNLASRITIEAAGNTFFVLRNPANDEIIVGKSVPKPLGWVANYYFKSLPVEIEQGTWVVVTGSPTIKLETDTNSMEVTLKGLLVSTILSFLVISTLSFFWFCLLAGFWKF